MDDALTYNVVYTGQICNGFDSDTVSSAFSDLLKVSPEKAEKLLGARRTLKKQVNIDIANAYKAKLEKIGLTIELVENAVPQETAFSLALEPIAEDKSTEADAESTANHDVVDDGSVTCPKCQQKQAMSEQCVSCGVYLHKVLPADATEANVTSESQNTVEGEEQEDDAVELEEGLPKKALMAAAGAAILGALLWKFIALAFEYELGLIAWAIGGGIGAAAAYFGAKGQNAGIACAVLTVCAIFGGKYLAVDALQQQFADSLATEFQAADFQQIYEMELNAAKYYVDNVYDDASLKQFMIDYEYTEAYDTDAVSQEEINEFKEYVEPTLVSLASSPPNAEDWIQDSLQSGFAEISTWDLVQESLGPIDLLFLILGVATAFRLGSRATSA